MTDKLKWMNETRKENQRNTKARKENGGRIKWKEGEGRGEKKDDKCRKE